MHPQEKILKCLVRARCNSLFYAGCIDEQCSCEDRDFFQSLSLQAAQQVYDIDEFARSHYGIQFLPFTRQK